jgi:Cu2+-exporting ATPase
MQSVESAITEKTPIVQLADRIGGIFVVAVTFIAVVTFAWWLPYGLAVATANATSLLIVACPCALALATPLAIAVGLGRAARAGILIRDGGAFQQLSRVGTLWFDKTGTLTEGRQRVSTFFGSEEGLRLAAAIESECRHPVALAIVREAQRRRLIAPDNYCLEQVLPGGILGTADGRRVSAGNLVFMRDQRIDLDSRLLVEHQAMVAAGASPIIIAVDGRAVAMLGMSDPVRVDAPALLLELAQQGWQVGVLSGDHPEIVRQVVQRLGLNEKRCFGGLTPEEKLAAIRESRNHGGSVVMVGDGANDAAALAAADVGIAIRGGAEVSLQAAPVFIASGHLKSIARLLRGARQTSRVIYLNFALSLTYNLIAVGLAMAGLISPLIAAILMPISSVSVLALTLAMRSFEEMRA